jgi:hypothetical protein
VADVDQYGYVEEDFFVEGVEDPFAADRRVDVDCG